MARGHSPHPLERLHPGDQLLLGDLGLLLDLLDLAEISPLPATCAFLAAAVSSSSFWNLLSLSAMAMALAFAPSLPAPKRAGIVKASMQVRVEVPDYASVGIEAVWTTEIRDRCCD